MTQLLSFDFKNTKEKMMKRDANLLRVSGKQNTASAYTISNLVPKAFHFLSAVKSPGNEVAPKVLNRYLMKLPPS